MRKIVIAAFGAVVFSAGLWAPATPASALGACGRNFHRNAWGRCVFGGQNQNWCLRHTGHVAGRGGYGTRVCR